MDTKALENIGWKLVAKNTIESGDNTEGYTVIFKFQALAAHACPVCTYSHAPNIQARAEIPADATDEQVREKLETVWADAVRVMLDINKAASKFTKPISKGARNGPRKGNPGDDTETLPTNGD